METFLEWSKQWALFSYFILLPNQIFEESEYLYIEISLKVKFKFVIPINYRYSW